ncbi:MAG: sigma-70 family RNA polymerase sigma factor [Sphingomonadaceae bacterium]|nr:sigma-70 family RNA polymerase sigma factor [Sphingomonadaceae bacterium]
MLAAIGAGERAALKQLYTATSAKLFGVILRILHERNEAEDVLQEVYITVWRKAAEFDASRASPITWMVTIARNRAIDRLRARGTRPTTTLDQAADVPEPAPSAEAMLAQSDDARRVAAALDRLDPRHAAVIRSAFYDGVTYEAIAERESVPVGTLKSWVRRGLIRMRSELAA